MNIDWNIIAYGIKFIKGLYDNRPKIECKIYFNPEFDDDGNLFTDLGGKTNPSKCILNIYNFDSRTLLIDSLTIFVNGCGIVDLLIEPLKIEPYSYKENRLTMQEYDSLKFHYNKNTAVKDAIVILRLVGGKKVKQKMDISIIEYDLIDYRKTIVF